jgi:hypothetical protein
MKGRRTHFTNENDDSKIKEIPWHKKHEQKGKVVIISLLLPKVPGKWPYMKWS